MLMRSHAVVNAPRPRGNFLHPEGHALSPHKYMYKHKPHFLIINYYIALRIIASVAFVDWLDAVDSLRA